MIKAHVTEEQLQKIDQLKSNSYQKDNYYDLLSKSSYMVRLDKNKSIDLTNSSDQELFFFFLAMKDQLLLNKLEFSTEDSKIEYNFSKKKYETSKLFGKKKNERTDLYVNIEDIDNYMLELVKKMRRKYPCYVHTSIFFDNSDNTIYHYFLTEEDEEERVYELF